MYRHEPFSCHCVMVEFERTEIYWQVKIRNSWLVQVLVSMNGIIKFLSLLINGKRSFREYQSMNNQSVYLFIFSSFISSFFYFHRLSSSSDLHNHRSTTQLKKPERSIFGRSQVYNDGLTDSFLVSSTLSLSQQGMKNTNIDKFISEFL
jgi:hypothetical protein